jgi:hypothetical protein
MFNPLNAELNSICHLLALLEAHPILHVSGVRVKVCTNITFKILTAVIAVLVIRYGGRMNYLSTDCINPLYNKRNP